MNFTTPPIQSIVEVNDQGWESFLSEVKPELATAISSEIDEAIQILTARRVSLKAKECKSVVLPTDSTEDTLLDLYVKGFGKNGYKRKGDEAAQARDQFTALKSAWNN